MNNLPPQPERPTQYIQDGILCRSMSAERMTPRQVVPTVPNLENTLPNNLETYP